MKSSPRLSLPSVMKRSFVTFGAALLVVACSSNAFAAVPVDVYVDFETGNSGDLLTTTNLAASTHTASGTWYFQTNGSMWISNNYSAGLPGPVTVGGVTYNGTGGTRSAMVNDNNGNNWCLLYTAGRQTKMTIAANWTLGEVGTSYWWRLDNIGYGGGPGACFQATVQNGVAPFTDIESQLGGVSTYSGTMQLVRLKTYWINLHYESATGVVSGAVFDPANAYAQVGTTLTTATDQGGDIMTNCEFGRMDNVGNWAFTTQTYFDNILVDYTNAAFPLIPSSGTDTTPPSAPPAVRDGTGTDITYTASNTQLSANWDASTDNQSGISGYQYAIGTTAGGTQTVNWTSFGNVTTVTKTGLSLTNGQTYFFSVQAINGVGLTGNATNSNGQKVDTSAPSAPPAVRDGTGTDIATTNSATQLSANWDASTDAESGISGYQYAIGTSAGGTQTVNWTSLGNATTVTKTGLSLTNGQTYYFSVEAVDGAGLTGNAANSNGQTVQTGDVTPPSAPPAVRDGTGTDISTTNSTTQLSANWDASTDAESGISGYQYAIGTSAGGTQTVNWISLGNVTTVTKTGLSLTVGQTYYFSVKAVNGAGLTGNATNSNGQTVVTITSVVYFQDNFESWTTHGGAWSSVTGETSTHTLNTSTDHAKAGAKGLKLTDTDTTSAYGAYLTRNFSPVISGDIYVRFYVFFPTGFGSTNLGAMKRVLRVFCGTNRAQLSFHDGAPVMEEVGSWGSAQGPVISENAWHCVEMHVAAPSASTPMEFWVDGASNGTLSGSFSGSSTFDHLELGDVCMGGGVNGTGTFYMDEVVVSNSYVGTGITSPVTYFQDAFDSWTVHGGAWSSVNGESAGHTLNTSTDQARSGSKSLKLTDTDSTGVNGAYLLKNFSPAISGDIYARFYVYLPSGYESANPGAARRILRTFSGSNRSQISVRGGGQLIMEEIGAWGSVSGPSLSESAWHCIEMHGTAPTATTLLEFWVDGVLNTAALMANFSASSTWDRVDLGDIGLGGGANGNGTFYLDEAVVSNSYIGPLP